MPQTSECIFCKIAQENMPSFTVYEDDHYVAFLDIFPRVKGHTLVIPKAHYRWVYDVPEFGLYWEVAKSVGEKLQQELGSKYISYLTMGNDVPHAHIHVLPQQQSGIKGFALRPVVDMSKEEMKELADKIQNIKY